MWRWRRVAVARVFALVVRCRIKRLLLYSRVGKNRDTKRESPAGAGAGRGASHKTVSLVTQLSRHGAPMTYTDLLATVYLSFKRLSKSLYSSIIIDSGSASLKNTSESTPFSAVNFAVFRVSLSAFKPTFLFQPGNPI